MFSKFEYNKTAPVLMWNCHCWKRWPLCCAWRCPPLPWLGMVPLLWWSAQRQKTREKKQTTEYLRFWKIWSFHYSVRNENTKAVNNMQAVKPTLSSTHPRVDARIHSVLASGSSASGSSGETSTSGPPPAREAWASTLWRQDRGKRLCWHVDTL